MLKIEMVEIPGGTFWMGSENGDDEKPVHHVTVAPLAMGKYPITQTQWEAVMGSNPNRFKGDDLPVERVSWNDAQEFCRKLSSQTGKSYRLPTEAEWEYACRAGTTDDYAGDLDVMAWYLSNAEGRTHPVGQKQPNAWGLFDMHGNVWEWCEDVWHDSYKGAPSMSSAWTLGGNSDRRIVRGGSWLSSDDGCRSAFRGNIDPGDRYYHIGFRVVVGGL